MEYIKRNKPLMMKLIVPEKIDFSFIDYLKAFYSWLRAFRVTFIVQPGLYYTGKKYDRNSPLLVTCNYHMTVFLLWRILHRRNVRLLVIDTLGINVWCSSGKGKFSAGEILKQIDRYDRKILTDSGDIELVLPKLSLSGVSLSELRKKSIIPRIGPIQAKDLPEYLDAVPLTDNKNDHYVFNMRERLFTLIPSLVQIGKYSIITASLLYAWDLFFKTGIHWQVVPLALGMVILYVILFPFLPTKRFALKGISLFAPIATLFALDYAHVRTLTADLFSLAFYITFSGGFILFFALSYTGNSGVSNYSLVKKEVIRFLPVSFLFILASLIVIILKGVLS
jgi:hypothetical protein